MSCCTPGQCENAGKHFSKWSRFYSRRFRKKGLERVQQYILEGVKRQALEGKHVLDIGCGVGALHMQLLQDGAAGATAIDASDEMLNLARGFSRERGLQDRSAYHLGDFVGLADSLPDAEITVMDKVVCCYEDIETLIDTSTRKTRQIIGLSYPRNNLLVGTFVKLQIVLLKLFRANFHPFWHDWNRMVEQILARGFRLVYERPTFAWNVTVFERI